MSDFIKGPWKATGNAIRCAGSRTPILVAEVNVPTSDANGYNWKDNAALIAAAPEMLDCLERILGAFPELGGEEPLSGADVIDYLNDELGNLKATIAKAKGES